MTLFKQIAIVMSLLVLILLSVTMVSNYESSSKFIRDQLYSNAKNTASSLGLAISKNMDKNDLPMIETMINAVFDSGYYEEISFTDIDGKTLYERKSPLEIRNVPQWFLDRVHLETVEAVVPVGRDWRLIGELKIRGHRGHAYEELWTAFTKVVKNFILFGLLALVVMYLLLKVVLHSLDRVRKQAEAVIENRFIIQKNIPRTIEFRNVVEAMNSLVLKVQDIYQQEVEAIAKYHELLYKDKETGFFNRNYFRIKLEGFLNAQDHFSGGYLLVAQIYAYDDLHKEKGVNTVHKLVKEVSTLIKNETADLLNAIPCRTREEDFMVILPATSKKEVLKSASKILNVSKRNSYPLTLVLVQYQSSDTLSLILAEVDNALMLANSQPEEDIYSYDRNEIHVPALGHDKWVKYMNNALKREAFILLFQPVKNRQNDVVQEEVLLRFKHKKQIFTAGQFMPIVAGIKMQYELDKYVIEHLNRLKGPITVAVNLSDDFILHSASFQFLSNFKQKWKSAQLQVAFEISNNLVKKDLESVKAFASYVQKNGWAFGIDHFTVDDYTLNLLQELKPDYLKIHAPYLLSLLNQGKDDSRTSSLFRITSLLNIHLIATGVDSQKIAEQLYLFGIEWLQGFWISKPSTKEKK